MATREFNIRAYDAADKPRLLELLQWNTPKYFAPSESADYNYYLDNEIELYYVIEAEGVIIGGGGINFEAEQTTAKISWDCIHPGFQGTGAGTALLQYRLHVLKGMEQLREICVRTSQLAYGFYSKNGFELTKTVDDYWAEGFDLYKMVYKR
ncbi:GNAT family N-acetyltransferase [Flavobacterium pallidum]|uniref:GNAT family N-acetyltransferase n=1 Tax=Flavobacterium pallidum TaxID=2172098 RepID=A0A2S1SIH5_9FLAO|nr:GNAT family N-acetyltransferase [Flavobacterium pallidum]AWI26200.1 GNAT family N-acetyltransferase [Flavobacterium pallidum]